MDAHRWAVIESLYHAALAKDAGERPDYLAAACEGNTELRQEVESLLVEADAHLTSPAKRAELEKVWEEVTSIRVSAGPTPEIGPYRMLEKIGEGGMAEVWLAEQTSPIQRRVAVKLIRAGMDTKAMIARFESERQALALMDHPAIAKILEAGSTAEQRPYFVLEYIPGEPITEYCDKNRLIIRDRLELFIQVCEGVQHAHQKAVIHRDLKPSNVLVTVQDGKPIPKIIDFGVAKAIAQKLTEKTMFTELGVLVGTPEYMSPEQADFSDNIDTRTDVYSLGMILYELLVGALPVEPRDLRRAGFEDFLRLIREAEPVRPSTKVRILGDVSAIAARNRKTDRQSLERQLKGDLDWTVMKALEKDRCRRYGSPSSFALDIEHYLRHEPVLARPPTLVYRTRKFVRRHRFGVGVAATVMLLLIGFAATMTVQARRIARERDRADSEAAAAQAVNDFLRNDVLAQAGASGQAGPETAPDPNLKVRTALDRAAGRITGKFAGKPAVEASIRQTIGDAYMDLGLFPDAEQQMEAALKLRRRILGEKHPDTLRTMSDLAFVYELQGRYGQAEPLYTETLEVRRSLLGRQHVATAASMAGLAFLYFREGKYTRAERLFTEALEIDIQLRGAADPAALATMKSLGMLYTQQAKYPQAESLLTKVLATYRRLYGSEHPQTLFAMENLGDLYSHEGKYEKAELLLTEVLASYHRVLGEAHPSTLWAMNALAILRMTQGRYAEAELQYLKVLDLRRRVLGKEHPQTLATMGDLAHLYVKEKKYTEAEPLFSTLVDARRRLWGEDDIRTLNAMNGLALVYLYNGKPKQSEAVIRGALDHLVNSPDSWRRFDDESLLGASLTAQKRYAEAEPLLISAHQQLLEREASIPVSNRFIIDRAGRWILQLYDHWGKPREAAEWRESQHLTASTRSH
ncbi:MAG: serine/threonine protein kinase [Acidobacteriaceae bacterium]|nr:serine/threonine protein kinase [Acidobacteriaceae bacterium]